MQQLKLVVLYGSPLKAVGPFQSRKRAARAAELLREQGLFAEVTTIDTWANVSDGEGIERSEAALRAAEYRTERLIHGESWRLTSSLGARRRLQALMCLGWSRAALVRKYGLGVYELDDVTRCNRIHRTLAEKVERIYAELQTTQAPRTTSKEKWSYARAACIAERYGYAPPAAWDDIDNPRERPKGLRSDVA